MEKGSNNEHEHWFSRCESLGWVRAAGEDGTESVTSPRGVSITWDPKKKLFRWDRTTSHEFRRLVNLVISTMDRSVHDSRVKIAAVRQTTRELKQVLSEREPSYMDNWTEDGGKRKLGFYLGPLEVTAQLEQTDRGVVWTACLSNGRAKYNGDGCEKDADTAKTAVYENLLEWCDELADTGRHAVKLCTRIKEITG